MAHRVLLLCDEAARRTGAIDDHVGAFERYSRHSVLVLDSVFAARRGVDLALFDAVVLHYSVVISSDAHLPPPLATRIAAFNGPKILFIQDEYRWIDRTMSAVERLGIGVLFTVANADVVRAIYRNPYFDRVRFEPTLTGFVPERLLTRPVPDYERRSVDVCYRARRLPAWYGTAGREKWQIGARFLADAGARGLVCDIAMSEASRLHGERWIAFLAGAKAMLGTESAIGFMDYTGEVAKAAEAYEAAHPEATFEEIRDRFLEGRDGQTVIRVISPRCFEAAALRTLMILYPGDYSGVLEAGRHYVPLARDHGNMDEVVAILRDPARARRIITDAYDEIACSPAWTYRTFMEQVDRVLDQVVESRPRRGRSRADDDTARQLARAKRRFASRARLKSRFVAILQRTRLAGAALVDRCLPRAVSAPLLAIGRSLARRIKPTLKRLLLRNDS